MKAVVFDLDGTLLDTIGDIANSMNYALKCYDIPPCTEDEVKSFVGNGLKMALARAIAKKAVKSVDENDQNLMFSLIVPVKRFVSWRIMPSERLRSAFLILLMLMPSNRIFPSWIS